MSERPESGRAGAVRMLERAVVMQVLRDDHERRWSLVELAREASDFHPATLEEAVGRLADHGVLQREGRCVWASPALRRLEELELIAI